MSSADFRAEDAQEAFADERLLQHVFTNLLSNAVKYSPAGGTVHLDIERDGDTPSAASAIMAWAFPRPILNGLFSAFYRGRNVGQAPGTGLGLTIVKRCVELHRGKIKVESAVGRGTTVTVKLALVRKTHLRRQNEEISSSSKTNPRCGEIC
jgi:signal transduction histidine kinase